MTCATAAKTLSNNRVGDDFRTSTRPQSTTQPNFGKSVSLLDPGPFNGSDDEFVSTGGGCGEISEYKIFCAGIKLMKVLGAKCQVGESSKVHYAKLMDVAGDAL
ncbi:hypothetical protein Tco_0664153 [Tanacetum coccineum]